MSKKTSRRSQRTTGVPHAFTLPDDFVRAARGWLGDEADAFLDACTRPPGLAVRANPLKGGPPALLPLLDPAAGSWPRVPWWPEALLPAPDEAARLAAHPLARIGALYAQDPAALAAVAALDPQPGERVLDLCAAPGGKCTAIAGRLAGRGLLVANDVEARRARELESALERWGAANAAVLALPPERLAALAPRFFDRVLVDAPCSGEAMFARRPRAAADWSPGHVAGCTARQRHILTAARRLVRPGGLLAYATCTFNPVENEGVIAAYLGAYPDDALEDVAARLPGAAPGRPDLLPADSPGTRAHDLTRCARLWPQHGPGAGHFIALIRVAGDGGQLHSPGDSHITNPLGTANSAVSPHPVHNPRATRHPGTAGFQPVLGLTPGRASGLRSQGSVAIPRHHVTNLIRTEDSAAVRALLTEAAPGLESAGTIVVRGDRAFLAPPDLPNELAAIALAPGLRVAERRGRTWRPAHALAMALRPAQARAAINLSDAEMARFLAGQPIASTAGQPIKGSALVLAAWRDYPLGWARARGNTLTPLLPSGLRVYTANSD